jgi:ribonucleoside-triphosphate reductase (thioredoxin)
LRPLDAHDMMCAVGDAAVSGGVRRTAMISLFDYDDLEMRHCKDGDFWRNNSQRWNANNSAVWPERELTQTEITRFVLDMVESGRGEPGIFNRKAAVESRPARRKTGRLRHESVRRDFVTAVSILQSHQRRRPPEDDYESLRDKVELAAIIGTIQAMATYFPGLRAEWRDNCVEERLLGVDLNGQMDSPGRPRPGYSGKAAPDGRGSKPQYATLLGLTSQRP